ncbi:MAG: OsmC family protein [Crocinitomicaceae bacterium]|nr:OsmC family protein [Crocinitomicaceae bacterium]
MSEIQHLETFNATAEGKGWPTSITITGTEWNLQADEPEEDGGSNSGPNPMQYFIASLASCQNEQAQVVAEELSITIDKIDITLAVDLNLDGFMGLDDNSEYCFKRANFNAVVHGEISEDQIIELGKRVDSRCPILSLLRSGGCEIESSWKLA